MSENRITLSIKKMSPLIGETVPVPFYATAGAAGMDLAACIEEPVTIPAKGRRKIPTGIAIELPSPQFVGLVFPRSGISTKHGINLANSVGVIDSDYRGEIQCVLVNQEDTDYTIQPGERIAQLVLMPVVQADVQIVEELNPTDRGSSGFGSTGS